jgi:hypothetical protein
MSLRSNTRHLFIENTPEKFWRLILSSSPSQAHWREAIEGVTYSLLPHVVNEGFEVETLLAQILGEGQFGRKHWKLSPAKQFYYQLKPYLPRMLTRKLRQIYRIPSQAGFLLRWPIEDRFVRFQYELIRKLLEIMRCSSFSFIHFWPYSQRFAFVLTHDIETKDGQDFVRMVADLEESLGFRSSFNFIPERYNLDYELMQELRDRGFEIGVHGLKHDGKLFRSKTEFSRRVERINGYLKDFDAVGFRAPLMHRHPEWMQALEIEYDLSFFDTDPYEPIPGGTMSIWPFRIGRFVELPYTLVQDYSLTSVLKEESPRIWLQKIDFIRDYCGMALLNTHPDYLRAPDVWKIYDQFLRKMKATDDYWHALPREVAHWWQSRADTQSLDALPISVIGEIRIIEDRLMIIHNNSSTHMRKRYSDS